MNLNSIPQWLFGATGLMLCSLFYNSNINAQNYIGIGSLISPKVQTMEVRNRYVQVVPLNGIGWSFSGRREFEIKRKLKSYCEVLISSRTLKYYQVHYTNDSINIWTDWNNKHTGFFTLNTELGAVYKTNNIGLSLGISVGLMPELDFGGNYSYRFDLVGDREKTSQFRAQLNLGIERELSFTKQLNGKARLFIGISPQDVVNGYTRTSTTTGEKFGTFQMNNSILGFTLYSNIKKHKEVRVVRAASRPAEEVYYGNLRKHQFSVEFILFKPPTTVYHVPFIDEFRLSGQDNLFVGKQLNLLYTRNLLKKPQWSIRSHLGIGHSAVSFQFQTDSSFTRDNRPMALNNGPSAPVFLEVATGITRSFVKKRWVIKQSLLGTLAYFPPEDPVYLGVPLASRWPAFPPFTDAILEGSIDDANGRSSFTPGFELRSDISFNLRNRHRFSIGLVINKSYGVIRNGNYKVTGNNGVYYGSLLQNHGKFGFNLAYNF
jgi:hypothetical protein